MKWTAKHPQSNTSDWVYFKWIKQNKTTTKSEKNENWNDGQKKRVEIEIAFANDDIRWQFINTKFVCDLLE